MPPKNDSGRNGPPERFQPKVLLIWLVIITAMIALWYASPRDPAGSKKFSITELVEVLKDGQIDKGDGVMKPDPSLGRDGYVISGQLQESGLCRGRQRGCGGAGESCAFPLRDGSRRSSFRYSARICVKSAAALRCVIS